MPEASIRDLARHWMHAGANLVNGARGFAFPLQARLRMGVHQADSEGLHAAHSLARLTKAKRHSFLVLYALLWQYAKAKCII